MIKRIKACLVGGYQTLLSPLKAKALAAVHNISFDGKWENGLYQFTDPRTRATITVKRLSALPRKLKRSRKDFARGSKRAVTLREKYGLG